MSDHALRPALTISYAMRQYSDDVNSAFSLTIEKEGMSSETPAKSEISEEMMRQEREQRARGPRNCSALIWRFSRTEYRSM